MTKDRLADITVVVFHAHGKSQFAYTKAFFDHAGAVSFAMSQLEEQYERLRKPLIIQSIQVEG